MKKSIYEFDTARKVLDFLKDKKEIKIRIEASDEWMGFSQLVDNDGEKGDWVVYEQSLDELRKIAEKEFCTSLDDTWGANDWTTRTFKFCSRDGNYDINRPVFLTRIHHLSVGYITKETIIKLLTEFANEFGWDELLDANNFETEFEYEFNEFINGLCGINPVALMDYFEATEVNSVLQNSSGKEICWCEGVEKEDEQFDIIFLN